MGVTLLHGDCREVLAGLPDCSVDSVVTDPPYEISFMNRKWDGSGIAYNVELWRECLRVLKPGGHLLAFGGTRTYHRMACAIEDAGFEVRDSLHWLYGSGFPKSLDVSKAIDKQRYDRADIYRVTAWIRQARDAAGISNRDIDAAFSANGMGRHWTDVPPHGKQPAVPAIEQVPTLLDVLGLTLDDVPDDIRRLLWDLNGRKGQPGENWAKREVVGTRDVPVGHAFAGPVYGGDSSSAKVSVTAPATDAARQWAGFGTALKPAHEPVVVARKPLVGTVAGNVLEHGTGALNIDGCRVTTTDTLGRAKGGWGNAAVGATNYGNFKSIGVTKEGGRWPANIVFTHAAECGEACAEGCPVAELDGQSGVSKSPAKVTRGGNRSGQSGLAALGRQEDVPCHNDTGGASRFFTVTEWDPIADVAPFRYVAKPSKRERNAGLDGLPERDWREGAKNSTPRSGQIYERNGRIGAPRSNHHPTVKPVALMRWLVRLVTPPGGVVLDPFAGSGTTLVAATLEGFDAIGIELTDDYLPIIEGRVAWAEEQAASVPETDPQPSLFEEVTE